MHGDAAGGCDAYQPERVREGSACLPVRDRRWVDSAHFFRELRRRKPCVFAPVAEATGKIDGVHLAGHSPTLSQTQVSVKQSEFRARKNLEYTRRQP